VLAAARVRAILEDSRREGVEVEITEVGNRPAGELTAQHPLVKTCVAILQHLGAGPQYAAASTDANVPLSRAIPALTLGITRGGGAHTVGEWIETAPMVKGVQQLVLVIAACAAAEPWAVREQ
jgi:tripeptide aminopeptidase